MVGVTRVLEKAGFDKVHAALSAAATIDYVWGFVIEEQAGTEPETQEFISALPNSQKTQSIRTDSEDDAFLSDILKEYRKLPPTEIFDWGLQLIITGLKSAIKKP